MSSVSDASVARRERLGLPNYQEAYPRLILTEARRAFDAGRTICVWSSVKGRRLGHAMLRLKGEHMLLKYRLFPNHGVPEQTGEQVLCFQTVPLGLGRSRELLTCPTCGRPKAHLILDQGWKCRECHGLHYRSSSIATKTRDFDNYDNIIDTLSKGRPKGMHERTYVKMIARMKELKRRINRAYRLSTSGAYQNIVSSSWLTLAEDDDWSLMRYFDDEPRPDEW